MPTTEFFGYRITNVGPLTTTFTPAASCTTLPDFLNVGDSENYNSFVLGHSNCAVPTLGDECYPSGAKFDEIASKNQETLAQGYFPYLSPGIECPSGWTTAGTIALAGEKESTSTNASGIFTTDLWPYDDDPVYAAAGMPAAKIFAGMINPGETVVWCCPSEHVVNIFGACISSVEVLSTPTEVCQLLMPPEAIATITSFQGSAWTPPLISIAPASTGLETERQTISSEDAASYVVVHSYPIVALVHHTSDLADHGGDKGQNNGNGNQDGDNKATSAKHLSLASLSVLLLSFVVGAGFIAPW